jgi:LAO/AO transport system kinase
MNPALIARALAGDRRLLARLLSVLEAGGPAAAEALRAVYPAAGQAHVIGLTGPPGSGKSTLAAALARAYRAAGERVAILAIDPTSPYTGGALLGDRLRMQELATDEGVFVRSMAARGAAGGLALAAVAVVAALDAAGYSRLLVETVGAGQGEVAVTQVAHTTVVLTVPGLGDEIQALKAGLLEIADVLVVNKADRPEADATRAMLEALQPPTAAWRPPVLATVATRGEGLDALVAALEQHRAFLAASEEGARRARARARATVLALAQAAAAARLAQVAAAPDWEPAWQAVAAHERTPYDVAMELLATLDSRPSEAAHGQP